MRVIVGDETGLLKSVELEKNEQRVISSREQARARGVLRACWYEDENQDASCRESVVVARANGIVESYYASHGKEQAGERAASWSVDMGASAGQCVGLGMLQRFGSVVRCSDAGEVVVRNSLSKGSPATFNVGAGIERMRVEPTQQTAVAVGGKERDLNVWSLETQQVLFRAKNVSHDKLDMRVPVWVKDFRFLGQGSSNGHRVVVGTGYHHVRLYDTNTKRRPVQEVEFGEYPINALCVSPDETRVFIADTTGNLDILDLRTLKHMGRCTGPVGAIRDIACHPTLPYVAAVGLDRMVHVFDINTRKYQHTVYAKQRLNTVLFCNDGVKDIPVIAMDEPAKKKHKGEEDGEQEFDFNDDDEEEEMYEGLEISDQEDEEEEDDDDDDDDEDSD